MKLLKQFKNRYDNITYKIYETDNGVKVLHLDNPATINFDLAVIHAAGAAFEIQEDVPRGTAHFLEHMLLNPNSYFRTQDDINRFEQGSKERPALDINAFTNKKNIIFEGHSHQKGALRIIDRFEKIYDFPKKKFSNLLEKERGIILAEKSRKLKKKSNASIMYMEHMFKGIADEFTGDTLGEEEDIKAIMINDLEKYYHNRILGSNAVISIQSNGELSKRIIDRIESFSKRFTFSPNLGIRDIKLKNEWRIGVFQDKRENGISIYFEYFEDILKKQNYKLTTVNFITAKLLEWLAFNILREKMSLIYNFSVAKTQNFSFKYSIYAYSFTTERSKIVTTLDEFYNLIYTEAFKFLKSKKGKEWFDDMISMYIFPKTTIYDSGLGEGIAIRMLEGRDIFNYNLAVKKAKELSIKDIQEYLKEQLEIPPHIWVEGDINKKEIRDILISSSFGKRFL